MEENKKKELQKELMELAEELSVELRNDFAEIGVVDDETALEYFYKFRHGSN